MHRALHAVSHLIEDHAKRKGMPVRDSASKLIEGDDLILQQLNLDQNEKEMLEHIVFQMEKERGLDRSAAMADMRFTYIYKVCDECGECNRCDLDPNKICDNCMKCVNTGADYAEIKIDRVILKNDEKRG